MSAVITAPPGPIARLVALFKLSTVGRPGHAAFPATGVSYWCARPLELPRPAGTSRQDDVREQDAQDPALTRLKAASGTPTPRILNRPGESGDSSP
jgi:hypothetical protein